MKKFLVYTLFFNFIFAGIIAQENISEKNSNLRGAFPFVDQLSIYDVENHEFKLFMDKNEVISVLGEADAISISTYYPPEKDKYNTVLLTYDEGIKFVYRKGYGKIISIEITSNKFGVSKDNIKINQSLIEDVFSSYGNETYMSSVKIKENKEVFHIAYGTRDAEKMKILSDFEENIFVIHFDFDYVTRKCQRISLQVDSGV